MSTTPTGVEAEAPARPKPLTTRTYLAYAAGEAELLADLGVLVHRRGDLSRAQGLYDRALAVDRAAGGSRTEGRVLGNLGAGQLPPGMELPPGFDPSKFKLPGQN